MTTTPPLLPIPEDAELFTRQDFGEALKAGHYILGEDGDSCWATADGYLPGWIELGKGQTRPEWATHVVWFAK